MKPLFPLFFLLLPICSIAQIELEAAYQAPIQEFARLDFPFAGEHFVVKNMNALGYDLYDADHNFVETATVGNSDLFTLLSISEDVFKAGPGLEIAGWFVDSQGTPSTEIWSEGQLLWSRDGDLYTLDVLPAANGHILVLSNATNNDVELLSLPDFTPIETFLEAATGFSAVELEDGSYRYCRINNNEQIEIYDETFSSFQLVSLPDVGTNPILTIVNVSQKVFNTDEDLEFVIRTFDQANPGTRTFILDQSAQELLSVEGAIVILDTEATNPTFFTLETDNQNDKTYTVYDAQTLAVEAAYEVALEERFLAQSLPQVGPTFIIFQRNPLKIQIFDQDHALVNAFDLPFAVDQNDNFNLIDATFDRFGSGQIELLVEVLGTDYSEESHLLAASGEILFSTGFGEFLQLSELPGKQAKILGYVFPLLVNVYGGEFSLSVPEWDIASSRTMKVQPNPTQNTIQWDPTIAADTYEVWGADGRKYQEGSMANNSWLEVADLPAGHYYLRLVGEQVWLSPFVKH